MFSSFFDSFAQPPVFAQSPHPLWDDEHISAGMLKAHLDPGFEGASRKHDFIIRSVDWISALLPPSRYPSLLDLGCGPGLYARQFAAKGYQVTGMDISQRSLDYAQGRNTLEGLNITYVKQNYLALDCRQKFDLIVLIYCDFGALSPQNGLALLAKIHGALKPGGRFVLDVFSWSSYENFVQEKTWDYYEQDGFWSPQPHYCFSASYKYPPAVTLEQTVVLTQDTLRTYYIWNRYFSPQAMEQEAAASGFGKAGLYADLAGTDYYAGSPVLAFVFHKPA